MTNPILKRLIHIITGVLFTLFFISLGLIVAIQWRGLYYHDIDSLNIVETSGFSEEIIRENYDALIDYCSPFFKGELSFPSMPSSENGIQHFAEVKAIFVAFYYILAISSPLLFLLLWRNLKKKDFHILRTSAMITVILPTIVGLACFLNFDRAFTIFHKLFFRNDYWLFDPRFDPIIEILPSEFFLHCALVIISIVILGSLLQYIAYRLLRNKL